LTFKASDCLHNQGRYLISTSSQGGLIDDTIPCLILTSDLPSGYSAWQRSPQSRSMRRDA